MATTTGYDLDTVREELVALRELTYLNTGTEGILAESVLARYWEATAAHDRYGHYGIPRAAEEAEDGRTRLATLLHVSPDELALTHNATDGTTLFAGSIAWPMNGAAEVLISNEEHPAILQPWYVLAAQGGPRVRQFRIGATSNETLANFTAALSERTVAIAVSHVSCETGKRIPIKDMCSMAHERGAWAFVDGAQSVGQFDFSPCDLGADVMTGNGHKWLCGPKGTGFVWISPNRLPELRPRFGAGTYEWTTMRDVYADDATVEMVPLPSARRFEYGTRNFAPYAGLAAALTYRGRLGADAIEAHQAALSTQLKRDLAAIPGVTVHTPPAWEDACGIVTFSLAGWKGEALSKVLWDDYRIIQRRVEVPSGVRVSVAYFNNAADYVYLCEAIEHIGTK